MVFQRFLEITSEITRTWKHGRLICRQGSGRFLCWVTGHRWWPGDGPILAAFLCLWISRVTVFYTWHRDNNSNYYPDFDFQFACALCPWCCERVDRALYFSWNHGGCVDRCIIRPGIYRGGMLTVLFLVACNAELYRAIGTSAAIGFSVALASAAGYAANGLLQNQQLPDYSLGYIYLPALIIVALTSIVTAPLGARTAYILPAASLRKIFAGLLYLLGVKLLLDFWN